MRGPWQVLEADRVAKRADRLWGIYTIGTWVVAARSHEHAYRKATKLAQRRMARVAVLVRNLPAGASGWDIAPNGNTVPDRPWERPQLRPCYAEQLDAYLTSSGGES